MKKLLALASVLALGGSLGVAALVAGSAPLCLRSPARGTTHRMRTSSVAIGDLNGDGKPDLATAKHQRGPPSTRSRCSSTSGGGSGAKR